MEYEYDGMEEYGGRVLWGRIAFFTVALLLMFFVGRCTTSAGVAEADAVKLRDQVAQLSEQNTRLNDQLAAAQANANNPLTDTSEAEDSDRDATADTGGDRQSSSSRDDTDSDSGGTSERSGRTVTLPEGSTTYLVEEGDTLNSIAKKFYGEERKYTLIATANKLTRGKVLVVGQKLIIPPDPDEQ
ncbi:MAG: LysM peptidoglycan-binding domain-containing protein [Egibacteraceae bacterium]